MAAIFNLRHTQTSNIIVLFFYCEFYGTENVLLPLQVCCYITCSAVALSRVLRTAVHGFLWQNYNDETLHV